MKFLYVDVDNRKVVGLFRNSNEEIIKTQYKRVTDINTERALYS